MPLHPILIDGSWRQTKSPREEFQATAPKTGAPLKDKYPVSSLKDVERALFAAQRREMDSKGYRFLIYPPATR